MNTGIQGVLEASPRFRRVTLKKTRRVLSGPVGAGVSGLHGLEVLAGRSLSLAQVPSRTGTELAQIRLADWRRGDLLLVPDGAPA